MCEYWMIEKSIDGQAHWWITDHSEATHWNDNVRWTTDSSKARHYESKADAKFVIGADMVGCEATGHIDCAGPQPLITKAPTGSKPIQGTKNNDQ